MKEIAGMTSKIVERAKSYQSDTVPIEDPATLRTPCPKCGGVVTETYRRFACSSPSCDFSIGKHPGSRTLEVDEVEQLLRDRTIGPLQGFISKMGRPFAAVLKITPEFKLEFDFGQSNADYGSEEPVDFSGQQPVERAQMEKLLADGRTDTLRGFVSNRTRRKFSAFLVKKPDGSIGFEFEPRAPRAGKTPRKAAKAVEPIDGAGAAARGAKGAKPTDGEAPARSTTTRATKATTRAATRTAAAKTARTAATKTAATKAAAKKTAAKKSAKAGGSTRKTTAGR
jgi:DNA topoisomerase-3